MYTLEELKQKTLTELKDIGWQINVLPAGDRRCRRNWIDALVGKNPPLLQLLKTSPAVEVDRVQEPIEVQRQEPIESKFGRIVYPKLAVKPIAQNAETRPDIDRAESFDLYNSGFDTAKSNGDNGGTQAEALGSQEGDRVLVLAGNGQTDRGGVLPHQPIELSAAFNDEQPPNRGDGKGRIEPKVSQSAIAPAAKTSTAHKLLELFKSKAHILEDSPGAKTEPKLIQSAINLATENLLDAEADWSPPMRLTFSDSFLDRYSPPTQNIHYKADTDGQLSLFDFEVESVDEPPDPDDFNGNMFAFWAAYDAWVGDNEPSFVHNEPLEVSLDSFCEWAPCPDDWYEPAPSEVMELSPAPETSSTCNFSIPTFDAWRDRTNRQTDSDEPPDTGIFAKLPKPKPPKFPPQAIDQSHDSHINSAQERYCITYCMTAAGSSHAGRSPPGGDVMNY